MSQKWENLNIWPALVLNGINKLPCRSLFQWNFLLYFVVCNFYFSKSVSNGSGFYFNVNFYRYQSRQTNTVVMFFQYYICKFPLFSTKYMINKYIEHRNKLNSRFRKYEKCLMHEYWRWKQMYVAKALRMILVSGLYRMWYGKSHIIFSIYFVTYCLFASLLIVVVLRIF
jgi:hypothetical protein